MGNKGYNRYLIYVIASIAACGGLLFGFDTGVISGAIPFFQPYFNVDDGMVEVITTAVLVGAIVGALVGGRMTDRLGRKRIILFSAVTFVVGTLWSGASSSVYDLIFARLLLGVAIGVSSFAVPLYLAEIAPTRQRGALVSMFQLLITVGVLVSYLSDLGFADNGNPECWRMMFYVGIVPALILLVGMLFLPETPRWLMQRGREQESRAVLERIESPELVEEQMSRMRLEIDRNRETPGWSAMFTRWMRTPLIIAVGIMFFQQFVGINTVIYYSPKIFLMAGFDGNIAAIWASVAVGAINLLFTVVSLYFVDRLGRRKLYFIGMSGIVLSLLLLGLDFLLVNALGDLGKWLSVILIFFYIAFFAISIGPLGWLIISEIFPQKVRGMGSSIGSLAVWVFNAVVTFTFFKIVKAFTVPGTELQVGGEMIGNPAGAFFFYALIALIGIVWGYYYVPETKGVPLEQIEAFWRKGGRPKDLQKELRAQSDD